MVGEVDVGDGGMDLAKSEEGRGAGCDECGDGFGRVVARGVERCLGLDAVGTTGKLELAHEVLPGGSTVAFGEQAEAVEVVGAREKGEGREGGPSQVC